MTTGANASSSAYPQSLSPAHPVDVIVATQLGERNRLTCAFRAFLAIPHIMLVGTPIALVLTYGWSSNGEPRPAWGAGPGALGALAGVVAVLAWFAIVFTGEHPAGLWDLAAFYLRWRVRAIAYMALLRDEYPPFDDSTYPVTLFMAKPDLPRNRVSVAFRCVLAIPHVIALVFVGMAWGITTMIAWFAILFTGRYPAALQHFAEGALRWTTRVEAYVLLLHDDYPPFALD